MSITDRDRKILIVFAALLVAGVYWLVLLSPKRGEAAKINEELTSERQALDTARASLAASQGSRSSFATDYAEIVRLGKAIPATVDIPSLLVQLDSAAQGSGINFDSIKVGARTAAATASPAAPAPAGSQPPAAPEGDAAAGGTPASSAPGGAAEAAGETVDDANANAAAAEGADGSAPAEAEGDTPPPAPAPAAPGLDTVPLDFTFTGSYFELADLLHRLKRFVRVANEEVLVRGRLLTIDGFTFSVKDRDELTAQIRAVVYLSPKGEGVTAGATPSGPAPAQAASAPAPAPAPAPADAPAPPAAAATP